MGRLSSSYSCVKYLMFAFNFLFWLLGCTVLAVGIWISIDPNGVIRLQQTAAASNDAYRQFLSDSVSYGYQSTAAYLLIAVGSFVALVGFLGCCGAIRESQIMLASFCVALTLIFGVLLTTGVFAILAKNDMELYIQRTLEGHVHKFYNSSSSESLMNFLQSTFKCCGAVSGSADYRDRVPSSCANNVGPCPVVMYHELTPNLVVIAGVAIGISVVLMMGILFSMLLCCSIRSKQ